MLLAAEDWDTRFEFSPNPTSLDPTSSRDSSGDRTPAVGSRTRLRADKLPETEEESGEELELEDQDQQELGAGTPRVREIMESGLGN